MSGFRETVREYWRAERYRSAMKIANAYAGAANPWLAVFERISTEIEKQSIDALRTIVEKADAKKDDPNALR